MRFKSTAVLIALAALSLPAPAASQALPRGFFGIVPQTAIDGEDTVRMRKGGVDTIRVLVSWQAVQPTPSGGFQWAGLDSLVATAARDRLEVLPFLYGSPRWISNDFRQLPIDSAGKRQAWTEFVRAAVERYGRNGTFWLEHGPGTAEPLPSLPVRAWQIWNEENFFYFTEPVSPARYARLLSISHRAIRRGDARADVVIGGLFGNPKQRPPKAMDATDFLDRLYRVGGVKGSFDAVALHPYAADNAMLRGLVEGVRKTVMRHHDRGAGLYVTELGWGSQRNSKVSFEVGLEGQARELRGAYRYLIRNRKRLNLKQVDWFTWKDVQGSCRFCDSSGLFRRGERFKPKPAWHAFVAATHGRF